MLNVDAVVVVIVDSCVVIVDSCVVVVDSCVVVVCIQFIAKQYRYINIIDSKLKLLKYV